MTATDLLPRLTAIGAHLARSAPALVATLIAFLESIVRALDAAVSARPDRAGTAIPPGDDGALREFLRRVLGWATDRLGEVDRAVCEVREFADGREVLILIGEGSLAGVARRLHRLTLGDRPFVALRPGDSMTESLELAAGGMVFVEARHLPRDLGPLVASIRDPTERMRLVVGAANAEELGALAAMLPRVATIVIPPLRERADEIDALIEAYRQDAAVELGAPDLGFRPRDAEWIRSSLNWIATLDDIEDAARRLLAMRRWGVTEGAARLGLTHGALSRWARRRGIPT